MSVDRIHSNYRAARLALHDARLCEMQGDRAGYHFNVGVARAARREARLARYQSRFAARHGDSALAATATVFGPACSGQDGGE